MIASLCGFAVSAQFVSLEFLEPPYYIALVGAGVLKLCSRSIPSVPDPGHPAWQPLEELSSNDFVWANDQVLVQMPGYGPFLSPNPHQFRISLQQTV